MLKSCGGVPATADNARLVVEGLAKTLLRPKFNTDTIQTVMVRRYNYKTHEYDLWDFVSLYEAEVRSAPEFDPDEGKFILEYVGGAWRIMSLEDFTYFYG